MSQGWDPSIEPINCKDPQAAALPHTIVAEKVDFYLGTLVSRRAPYTIRIDFDAGHCILVLPLQSFPLNKGSYCVKQPIGDGHNNIVVDLDNSYRNQTIKYGFVSPKG